MNGQWDSSAGKGACCPTRQPELNLQDPHYGWEE